MSEDVGFRQRNKFRLQTTAFLLIVLPSIGLYFSVTAGANGATVACMMLITVGMMVDMWVS